MRQNRLFQSRGDGQGDQKDERLVPELFQESERQEYWGIDARRASSGWDKKGKYEVVLVERINGTRRGSGGE